MDKLSEKGIELIFKLIGRLQGDEGDSWMKELDKFLQGRNTWDGVNDLTTINIGTHKSVEDLLKILESTGEISYLAYNENYVKKRVANIIVSKKPIQLDLITTTPENLGLGKHFEYSEWEDICKVAIKKGFTILPEEAALQLQIQYREPSKSLTVITQPTLSTDEVNYDKLWLYNVGNNGGGHFRVVPINDISLLANYAECVFVRSLKDVETKAST